MVSSVFTSSCLRYSFISSVCCDIYDRETNKYTSAVTDERLRKQACLYVDERIKKGVRVFSVWSVKRYK
jgi:hypothetical protein